MKPANKKRQYQLLGFCLIQVLVVPAAIGWVSHGYRTIERSRDLPTPRREPLRVLPTYDDAQIVSDAQLLAVLETLKPRLRGPHPKINHVDHALRMWGVEATFDDAECLSGQEMRALLLDHRSFARSWGSETDPFLIPDMRGVGINLQDGPATASHVDHSLAGLAEVGTPLDYPVITPLGETQLRAVLEHSLREFSLNQHEYEWSTLTYALYLPPTQRWFSTEGQEITFDRLADRIMRQRLAQGVCRGQHRLHALVMLLRIDQQQSILSAEMRERIVAFLQDVTDRLTKTQHADGYWDQTWPGMEWDGPQTTSTDFSGRSDRILVTGHVLEWWALAPESALPPREVVIRAGQWLSRTITDLSPQQVRRDFTFLSHAGRALSLWRGMFPAEAYAQLKARQESR